MAENKVENYIEDVLTAESQPHKPMDQIEKQIWHKVNAKISRDSKHAGFLNKKFWVLFGSSALGLVLVIIGVNVIAPPLIDLPNMSSEQAEEMGEQNQKWEDKPNEQSDANNDIEWSTDDDDEPQNANDKESIDSQDIVASNSVKEINSTITSIEQDIASLGSEEDFPEFNL